MLRTFRFESDFALKMLAFLLMNAIWSVKDVGLITTGHKSWIRAHLIIILIIFNNKKITTIRKKKFYLNKCGGFPRHIDTPIFHACQKSGPRLFYFLDHGLSINPPVKVTRTREHTVWANGVNLTHILCFVLSGSFYSHVFFFFLFFSPSSLMSSMLLLCRLRSPVSAHIDFLSKRFLNP